MLITDSLGRHLSKMLNKTLIEKYDVSCFLNPNGKICHILDSVGTEAKYMNKEDFLMIICGTTGMNQNFTGLL